MMQQAILRDFGRVSFRNGIRRESFVDMIKSLNLTPPVVIKPNWGFSVVFTEADIIDWTLLRLMMRR
jgi:hypothetical protein